MLYSRTTGQLFNGNRLSSPAVSADALHRCTPSRNTPAVPSKCACVGAARFLRYAAVCGGIRQWNGKVFYLRNAPVRPHSCCCVRSEHPTQVPIDDSQQSGIAGTVPSGSAAAACEDVIRQHDLDLLALRAHYEAKLRAVSEELSALRDGCGPCVDGLPTSLRQGIAATKQYVPHRSMQQASNAVSLSNGRRRNRENDLLTTYSVQCYRAGSSFDAESSCGCLRKSKSSDFDSRPTIKIVAGSWYPPPPVPPRPAPNWNID